MVRNSTLYIRRVLKPKLATPYRKKMKEIIVNRCDAYSPTNIFYWQWAVKPRRTYFYSITKRKNNELFR